MGRDDVAISLFRRQFTAGFSHYDWIDNRAWLRYTCRRRRMGGNAVHAVYHDMDVLGRLTKRQSASQTVGD